MTHCTSHGCVVSGRLLTLQEKQKGLQPSGSIPYMEIVGHEFQLRITSSGEHECPHLNDVHQRAHRTPYQNPHPYEIYYICIRYIDICICIYIYIYICIYIFIYILLIYIYIVSPEFLVDLPTQCWHEAHATSLSQV